MTNLTERKVSKDSVLWIVAYYNDNSSLKAFRSYKEAAEYAKDVANNRRESSRIYCAELKQQAVPRDAEIEP